MATTVIEVGIDVPNASVMVIENAERFGLSQLHQLRGRVGRGSDQSYCILMTERWIAQRAHRLRRGGESEEAMEQYRAAERRLAAMVQTTDGFAIAEADLALRGPGDFFGTRQSGMPAFRVADPVADVAILTRSTRRCLRTRRQTTRISVTSDHRALADHLRARFREELVADANRMKNALFS